MFQRARCRKRGGFTSLWSMVVSGLAVSLQDGVFWRIDLQSSVISQFLGVRKRLDSGP